MAESEPTLSNLSHEDRTFPPSDEFAAQANATEESYARAEPTARRSGPSRPIGCTGTRSGTGCWTGTPRTRSGSPAAS